MSLGYHTIFLMQDGSIKGVGMNSNNQLGIGNFNDQSVIQAVSLSGVKEIAYGASHTMFLMQDGTVKATGQNRYGQLGNNNPIINAPFGVNTIQDINLLNVKQIACGTFHTMFLMQDGTVKAVGYNVAGQLGTGDVINQSSIQTLSLTGVRQVACGSNHTMFLMEDGTVKAVGQNEYGQLGVGNTNNQTSIQAVPITGVKEIICGTSYTIFLMLDGTAKSVGRSAHGQLANGSTATVTTIQNVLVTEIKKVACGSNHTVFLLKNGTVKSVGSNSFGELGNGTTSVTQAMIQSINLEGVKDIWCGASYTMFLMNDGTVKCTGYNSYGSLGIGNTNHQSTIQSVPITGVLAIEKDISMMKLLFQHLNQIKTWLSGSWKSLSGPLTKDLFIAEGVSSLSGIPTSALTNGTKILKWSDDASTSKLVMTVPRTLYDASNKLYKGIGIVETATETLAFKPKTLIVNADHTEAIFSFSLDDGATWYTITSGEVKDISGIVGTKLKVRASLPTATSTLTALSYAWA